MSHSDYLPAPSRAARTRLQTNGLQHIVAYLRSQLDDASRRELLTLLEAFRRGLVLLIVPITLIQHYVRRYDIPYLRSQICLDPHPKELRWETMYENGVLMRFWRIAELRSVPVGLYW